MNKKDREALDKFVDEDSLSPEDIKRFAEMTDGERATFIAERFFEAGAKHGRSQLNELRDDNMAQLYETIKEMQSAYETLQAHDEMLIATVKKMNLENDKLINALQFYAKYQNDNPDNEYNNELARQVLKEVGEE